MRILILLALLPVPLACGQDRAAHNPDGSGAGDAAPPDLSDDNTLSPNCRGALVNKSYIGCEYWPTVTGNPVWSIFDFAVIVANTSDQSAHVTITGPNHYQSAVVVARGALQKIFLPWVRDLKGEDFDDCVVLVTPPAASVRHDGGAYHLVSDQPVTVYQFNALEYKGQGGPELKDWSACPGINGCRAAYGCFSFSNDASLLLPAAALTGNYRIPGLNSEGGGGFNPNQSEGIPGFFAVTGTQDGTTVTVRLAAKAQIRAGGGLLETPAGGTATFKVNAGDVVEVMNDGRQIADLGGTLVKADKPIQVIAGAVCFHNPKGANACDHLEESVFPAETLGKRYVVTVPTGPRGVAVGHTVRLYGNVDGTRLTFDPPLANAPARIDAGQMVDLGQVVTDFAVAGDHEFTVASFMLGGSIVDAMTPMKRQEGDPSQTQFAAVEQYRTDYLFLAPDDYDFNFADVVLPTGTALTLDGVKLSIAPSTVGASGFSVARLPLDAVQGGVHHLVADHPVGIQVLGYGVYTSYQYPGGLDLVSIAPPPG